MEWIQRNPKKAVGLSALAVLVVIMVVCGASDGSQDRTAGPAPLATPTTTPTSTLPTLPTPSTSPTAIGDALSKFPTAGMGFVGPGFAGEGTHNGLAPHRIVIAAGSDGPLLGVGWRMPTADGARSGKDVSYAKTFRHATTVYGEPDYAQLYTIDGPESSRLWCTITVDGKVTDRQEAKGPWGQVFCQG